MTHRTFTVSGMACGGCEQTVEDALSELSGVTSVSADNEADTVAVTTEGDVDDDVIKTTIEDAGYEVAA